MPPQSLVNLLRVDPCIRREFQSGFRVKLEGKYRQDLMLKTIDRNPWP